MEEAVAKTGILTAGAGRPNYKEVALERLLDLHRREVMEQLVVRARRRSPRKVDAVARAGFAGLFHRVGLESHVRFEPIDSVLRSAYPQHRPPQRRVDTVRFCEEGILRPSLKLGDELEAIREPSPLLVPELVYGWGGL